MDKIIIKPTKVRAYGNIVESKIGSDFTEYDSLLTVSEDTVNGETVTVFQITPEYHNYSLNFSQFSYVATGGSATLQCTLLDNNVPVAGATITVTGSDSSSYNGITDNNGVAEIIVSVSTNTDFICSYANVHDTCNVIVQSYLIYDDCSADRTSDYGSSVTFSGASSNSLAFATDEYIMSGSGGYFSGRELTALSGVDDCKLRIKFKLNTTASAAFNQFCIFATDQTPSSTEISYPYGARVRNDKLCQYFTMKSESTIYTNNVAYSTGWYYLEVEKDGTSWTINLYDGNLNRLATNTRTLAAMTGTVKWYMVIQTEKGTNYSTHIQEIIAEEL